MSHTPGPWTSGDEGWLIYGPTEVVAETWPVGEPYVGDQAKANGRLIAAAPDLLREIQNLHYLACIDHATDPRWQFAINEAADAIAKAIGDTDAAVRH
jgi:hypothetical protein